MSAGAPATGDGLGAVLVRGPYWSARSGTGGMVIAAALTALAIMAGCATPSAEPAPATEVAPSTRPMAMATTSPAPVPGTGLPGMPPMTDPHNVYAAAGVGMLSVAARWAK